MARLSIESQTFRTKVNYQFTRALSARVIVEYDSTLANPAETSLLRAPSRLAPRRSLPGFRIPAPRSMSAITTICKIWTRRSAIACPAEPAIPNNTAAPRSTNF
jgi:hypothetical protein